MNSKLSGYAYKDITIFSKPVQQMSWSIDGNLLATAGNDKAYKILQARYFHYKGRIASASCYTSLW